MLKISGLVDRQYVISVHPVIGSEKMSFWSLSWETFKDRRDIFTLGGGGAGPGPGAGNPATAACIAATNWANKAAPVGGSPAGPTDPGSPGGGGGGGGGGGAGPPPRPPAPPPSGTGAAISNTQCNNRLNPTLVVDNWSFYYCLCKHPGCLQTIVDLQIASDFGCLSAL